MINCWVRALRGFFNWLYQNDYTDQNRLKNLRLPKPTIEEIDVLGPEQIQNLLDACSPRTHLGCRNRATVMLVLDGVSASAEIAR